MGVHCRFPEISEGQIRAWTDRDKRYAIEALTSIVTEAGKPAAALVSNLSNNGCRIVSRLPLKVGERLKLVAEPLGLVEAEVRWTKGKEAGLRVITRDPFHRDYKLEVPP